MHEKLQDPPKTDTIAQGDAVEVMKTMPSGSVDLVVTSPPYNLKTQQGMG